MLKVAVYLVEPERLHIVAANGAAGRLLGGSAADLVGRDMLARATTPEDESFWQGVAWQKAAPAGVLEAGAAAHAGGQAVPVVRG